jgi:hypothetical protein
MNKIFIALIAVCLYQACQLNTKKELTTAKLTFTKANASQAYPAASLSLKSLDVIKGDSLHELKFSFDVQNFQLGTQTSDAPTRGIANSMHGQHIHFIVNNGPYEAHYPAEFTHKPTDGSYVLLAFLSRSYHESVKESSAWWIDTLTIGNAAPLNVDLTAPHLFYSRPKGVYKGADTQKIMIDFYLLNTTLSADGNKVKATINGEELIINEWEPYFVEGLPMGESTITLELIDRDGNLIPGPYNQVTRKIILSE